ncbi:hypothetical protein CDL15_Pgr027926 [Punica granatum]|uniref:Uncharacterized protein n=1 Tax=Punica granatum TaxID=22663 RepID=A0A218XKC8_PUNGR|nr:hypothetical protein CDL15_Pgr027926 [Punica granatum]
MFSYQTRQREHKVSISINYWCWNVVEMMIAGEVRTSEEDSGSSSHQRTAAIRRAMNDHKCKTRIPPVRGGVKRRIFALLYKHTLRQLFTSSAALLACKPNTPSKNN